MVKGIEICGVYESTHRFPEHSHDDLYALSLMDRGGSYWHGEGHKDTLVEPDNIAVINPGQVHSGAPANGTESTYRMIYVHQDLFERITADIMEKESSRPEFINIVRTDPQLSQLYTELYSALRSDCDPLEIESALFSFSAHLLNAYSGSGKVPLKCGNENAALTRAKELLSSCLNEKITLGDAADAAALSRHHFLRTFKGHFGISPHVYRTQQRLSEAKKLIIEGRPFSEIALETGFTDQSHFTNQFRKYTGATPSQYMAG